MLGLSVPEARLDKLLGHYCRQAWSRVRRGMQPQYHVVFVRPSGALLQRVKEYCQQGKLRPVVGTVFRGGLEDVRAAHDAVEKGHVGVGKVVVQVIPEEVS